jgi:hypothetical protein
LQAAASPFSIVKGELPKPILQKRLDDLAGHLATVATLLIPRDSSIRARLYKTLADAQECLSREDFIACRRSADSLGAALTRILKSTELKAAADQLAAAEKSKADILAKNKAISLARMDAMIADRKRKVEEVLNGLVG